MQFHSRPIDLAVRNDTAIMTAHADAPYEVCVAEDGITTVKLEIPDAVNTAYASALRPHCDMSTSRPCPRLSLSIFPLRQTYAVHSYVFEARSPF